MIASIYFTAFASDMDVNAESISLNRRTFRLACLNVMHGLILYCNAELIFSETGPRTLFENNMGLCAEEKKNTVAAEYSGSSP